MQHTNNVFQKTKQKNFEFKMHATDALMYVVLHCFIQKCCNNRHLNKHQV